MDSDDVPRLRAMTTPPRGDFPSYSQSMTHLNDIQVRPVSPALSWRSSTSSLADTSIAPLIHPPSSEQKILNDIKKQMADTFLHTGQLEKEVNRIPKLKNDILDLQKEREKLLNELLEQRAVVLQLKQRVILLHEQNQQLAKLAQSESTGNSQILAIRNTLVATLAQLKQMEDQVQTIPSLKSQIRELEDEKRKLLSVSTYSNSDEPQDASTYQGLLSENAKLKKANAQFIEDIKVVSRHLTGISDSCEGLQSRMEVFQSSQEAARPLQERIKKLELEKDALYQELVDSKYRHNRNSSVDLDSAHLRKQIKTLKKSNSRLQSKIEQMKIEARQQKEQLVLKLFEIESLNVKTSKYEIEKQMLEMEQLQVSSSSTESHSSLEKKKSEEFHGISPNGRALMLRFQQLEVHSCEMQNVLKTFMNERQELEVRLVDLNAKVDQSGIEELESKLEESESKLALARERIKSLENSMARKSPTPEEQIAIENERDDYKEKMVVMETELRRLSIIEKQTIHEGNQTDEFIETKAKLEKTKIERDKLSKKFKEGRNRLKSLASELAKSAELIKQYQIQCLKMEEEIKQVKKEYEDVKGELIQARARLEVKDVELQSSIQDCSITPELQQKIDELTRQLAEQRKSEDTKTTDYELQIKQLQDEVLKMEEKENTTKKTLGELESQILELNSIKQELDKYREMEERSSRELSDKTRTMVELEYHNSDLKTTNEALSKTTELLKKDKEDLSSKLFTAENNNKSLAQKLEILSQETPLLHQQSAELKVMCDSTNRKLQEALEQQSMASSKATEAEAKLEEIQKLNKELKKKLHLVQSDLDQAEHDADEAKNLATRRTSEIDKLKNEMLLLKTENEEEMNRLSMEIENQRKESMKCEVQLKEAVENLKNEVATRKLLEEQNSKLKTDEIPRLHSELAKTVSEMGQLTTDYSARITRIRELESNYQSSESERLTLTSKLSATEKEIKSIKQTNASLTSDKETLSGKLKDLESSHLTALDNNQKMIYEIKNLKADMEIKRKECKSSQDECAGLKDKHDMNVLHITELESNLKKIKEESSNDVQELKSLKVKFKELEAQCELLTATRDNLLNRLDKMEKLEMDYDMLKHRIHEVIGQSSQLKNDNKALLRILEDVEAVRPALEKEATRNLQEENLELHQQVSLLSQWNDRHQQNITGLEQQIDVIEGERRKLLDELKQIKVLDEENRQLKKELGEAELEVNRLKRQAHDELNEEMKVKMETQAQLLSIFNEHNRELQLQVVELMKQVKELGGKLKREKPLTPPPLPDVSDALQYVSSDARKCSELQIQNVVLQQHIDKLQTELIAAQEISPIIRRRSSMLLALSSVPPSTNKDDAFIR
jgi:chromosome segregation ATPase